MHAQAQEPRQRLEVSKNGRYLMREDGVPFLYIGDTAWELFHRLTFDEADYYLRDRARKGFTVIQAVALAEIDGLTSPNANGDLPFVSLQPGGELEPNEPYFAHVDRVVSTANDLGMTVGLLPTWGRHWKATPSSDSTPNTGDGAALFTARNARAFGEWMGSRYKQADVIWILGGDRNIDNDAERALIDAMADGLRTGDEARHLMTYHPLGPGRSREQLDDAEWIDFHMCQTSHAAAGHDTGLFIEADYVMDPPKPVLDGEPRYEGIPVGFYYHGHNPAARFTDYDSRTAAWGAILAGSCGHTYGNNNVWQMWDEGRKPLLGASVPWHKALAHPGAAQMGYLRHLLESVEWWKLEPEITDRNQPATSLPDRVAVLADGPNYGPKKIRASKANDGSFALVYSPKGEPFTVRLDAIEKSKVRSRWFSPRYGTFHPIYSATNRSFQTYTPPTKGDECDWLLILDGG